MNDWAPEYTQKEKIILLAKHLSWALPLFAVTYYWFLPWLNLYAKTAHCYHYGTLTGIHFVLYGTFVGIPLLSALTLFALEGPRSIKVIKLGQSPLPNEKVFRPTRYNFGTKAKLRPIIFFIILALLVALAVRGVFWANELIASLQQGTLPECVTA